MSTRIGRLEWSVVGSFVVVAALLVAVLLAEHVAPQDPLRQQIARRLLPPVWEARGSPAYPLGTDQLGRDILSRIVHGARVSLSLGGIAVGLTLAVGGALGIFMGYLEGRVSTVLLRLSDVQLAFPFLVLAISVVALFGATFVNLVLVLVLWSWPAFARLARAQVLVEKQKEYVVAARALGASPGRIVARALLPNVFPPLLALTTLTLAQMIIFESALSFLGFGVPPPAPSWGAMLGDGRDYVATAWWLVTFPGLALMVTVLAINTLGDRLQDRLGP
jgi:peptide/nickel transport system permease protein